MVRKAYEAGWGGVFFKTVGIFVADECSQDLTRQTKKACLGSVLKTWNRSPISRRKRTLNLWQRLKRDYPEKVMVATIMGSNDDEWKELAKMCEQAGADLIEGNFSCPQMTSHAMGSDVGSTPELVKQYSQAVTSVTKIPFIAKMTPNVTNMVLPARAAIEGGAAGVSAINTVKSITNIDFENMTAMPVVNGKSSISGYSGAAVKPIALRFVCSDASG